MDEPIGVFIERIHAVFAVLDERAELRLVSPYGDSVLEVHIPIDGGAAVVHHGGFGLNEAHPLGDVRGILVEVPACFESIHASHSIHHAGDVPDVQQSGRESKAHGGEVESSSGSPQHGVPLRHFLDGGVPVILCPLLEHADSLRPCCQFEGLHDLFSGEELIDVYRGLSHGDVLHGFVDGFHIDVQVQSELLSAGHGSSLLGASHTQRESGGILHIHLSDIIGLVSSCFGGGGGVVLDSVILAVDNSAGFQGEVFALHLS